MYIQGILFHLGDIMFTLFHSLLILFNLFGWIKRKWRKWHMLSIFLTISSWLVLGIWFGIGYCPLTDWHYQLLRKIGYNDLPPSYISFIVYRLTGLKINELWTDWVTGISAGLAFMISLWLNFRIQSRIMRQNTYLSQKENK
ncbi:MAG TPA: DUF2784 domain-containing protein [Saprospiraceae bacterium]|nr:DUF2784 domain-containing protein [Saprospiraceae bacterium]